MINSFVNLANIDTLKSDHTIAKTTNNIGSFHNQDDAKAIEDENLSVANTNTHDFKTVVTAFGTGVMLNDRANQLMEQNKKL